MRKRLKFISTVLFLTSFILTATACAGEKSKSGLSTSADLIIKGESILPTEWPKEKLENQGVADRLQGSEAMEISDYEKDSGLEGSDDGIESYEVEIEGKTAQNSSAGFGSVVSPDQDETVDLSVLEKLSTMPAASMVKVITANGATLASCFYSEKISPEIYNRMEYKSFSEDCTVPLDNLRYVRVLHYGFDGEIYIGELVVNQLISEDIINIFKELFDAKYPIERMVLVDEYDADDEASMKANNTYSFNFYVIEGTSELSNHSYGLAIDINPLYNPFIKSVEGSEKIYPKEGKKYVDRELECAYYINKDDLLYKIFISYGFTWGGDRDTNISYQHFQKQFK